MTMDEPDLPGQKEVHEEFISRILAQLLKINRNSVDIRVILIGSVIVIFTIPLKSAERLQTLWQTKSEVVKDAFLYPPGGGQSLNIRTLTRTVGGTEWHFTAESLSCLKGEKEL